MTFLSTIFYSGLGLGMRFYNRAGFRMSYELADG